MGGRPASEKSDRERLGHLGRPTNAHVMLGKWIRRYGWTHGAEIGVLRGKTFFNLLNEFPELRLIGVDRWRVVPFREDECAETYQGFPMDSLKEEVLRRAERYKGRAKVIVADSAEAAKQIPDGTLDFVFIDGDHTEAGFRRDLKAWAPKVHMQGFVTGHDWNWPTVKRVLDVHCPGWNGEDELVWIIERCRMEGV